MQAKRVIRHINAALKEDYKELDFDTQRCNRPNEKKIYKLDADPRWNNDASPMSY